MADIGAKTGHPRAVVEPRRVAFALALTALVESLIICIDWLTFRVLVTSMPDESVTTKFNTAVGLILSSLAIIVYVASPSLAARFASLSAALALLALGTVSLAHNLGGYESGIDRLFIADGHMSPATSIALIFLAAGALALHVRRYWLADLLGLMVAAQAALTLVSYLYSGHSYFLVGPSYPGMAILSSIAILLLGLALVPTHPGHGLMIRLNDPGPSGVILRRLVPLVIGAGIFLGFLGIFAESQGWLAHDRGIVTAIVTILAFMIGIVWYGAVIVGSIDGERLLAMASMAESEERFRATFEQAAVGIAHVAIDGHFLRANQRFCDIVGYGMDELAKLTIADLTHPDDSDEGIEAVARLLKGDISTCSFAKRYVRKDGHFTWVEITASLLRETNGQPKYFIGVVQDISGRKKAEWELNRLNDTLEEQVARRTGELTKVIAQLEAEIEARRKAERAAESANQAKTTFLAHMSHEMRTPLGVIIGYADFLLKPSLSEEVRLRHAAAIQRNAQNVLALLNDLLDLSKVESAEFGVEAIEVDLVDLVIDLRNSMRIKSDEKGLCLDVRVDGDIPAKIISDPMRIRQVLLNVVSNAVKFTDHGRVEIALASRALHDPFVELAFTVTDTGVGISPEGQARLFQPFSQSDATISRRFGGTGLGLCLSKALAHKLDGELRLVKSGEDGSVFEFVLRAAAVGKDVFSQSDLGDVAQIAPRRQGATSSRTLEGVRVLLVEDFEDSRNLFSTAIAAAEGVARVAANGREALEMLALETFDVVVMDLQMPVMDGMTAMHRLREQGYQRPIVALTAHAMQEERERCLAAGFSEYASKPIKPNQLVELIARQAGVAMPFEELSGASARGLLDDPILAPALRHFARRLPTQAQALAEALAANDLEKVARSAHQIKGSGGCFGFPELSSLAGRIEEECVGSRRHLEAGVARLSELARKIAATIAAQDSPQSPLHRPPNHAK